jgi:hypothetical protein
MLEHGLWFENQFVFSVQTHQYIGGRYIGIYLFVHDDHGADYGATPAA